MARPYHGMATGHDDKIAEMHIMTGKSSKLGESFITYYENIKTDELTRFVSSIEDIDSLGNWPSLFKGNALIRQPHTHLPNTLEKRCVSSFCNIAEKIWLTSRDEMPRFKYFHPIKLKKECKRNEPFISKNISIPFVEGITATKLLFYLQKSMINEPKSQSKLEILASALVYQAFEALEEFREAGKIKIIAKKLRPYPWEKKLEAAFLEAGRFIPIDNQLRDNCRKDIRKLGKDLQKEIRISQKSAPFRDAHLKNRLIKINNISLYGEEKAFTEWVKRIDSESIFSYLIDNTVDIDFETALYKVTEHDDPLHILFSQDLGLKQVSRVKKRDFDILQEWWPDFNPKDKIMWKTLLARSFREYCRRLWYNHVMPWTYQERYSMEVRDHFLDLAGVAVNELDGYSDILNFLEECHRLGDSIWISSENKLNIEPIAARMNPLYNEIDSNICVNEGLQSLVGHNLGYTSVTPQIEQLTTRRVDFLLITPLPEERDAVLKKLTGYKKLPPIEDDIHTYFQAEVNATFPDGRIGLYNVIVLPLIEIGQTQAATATTTAIDRWRPRFIVVIGIAGGIGAKGVKIGDILIADKIVNYELQKVTPEGPEIRWDPHQVDQRLLSASNNFIDDESWKNLLLVKRPGQGEPRHFKGTIASGDKVVAFKEFLKRTQENWPKVIGVDMEASGAAKAAFQSSVPPGFFMVRCVSDLADENKDSAYVKRWRLYACDVAASYTIALLRSGPIPMSNDTR